MNHKSTCKSMQTGFDQSCDCGAYDKSKDANSDSEYMPLFLASHSEIKGADDRSEEPAIEQGKRELKKIGPESMLGKPINKEPRWPWLDGILEKPILKRDELNNLAWFFDSDKFIEKLAQWYSKLNSWEWPYDLPGKPKNWDSLPGYYRTEDAEYGVKLTKSDIIDPICSLIEELIGEKEILRYHHLVNLKKTHERV